MKITTRFQSPVRSAGLAPLPFPSRSHGGRPSLALGTALACVFLLAACTGESAPEGGKAAATVPADTAAPSAPPAAATSDSVAGAGPGAVARLDTGVDLRAIETETPAPPSPSTEVSVDPNAGPANPTVEGGAAGTHGGLPGHLALAEGEKSDVDFGKVKQGDKRSHVFRLVSDGKHDLVISRFKSSCGCTVAEMLVENENGEMVEYTTGDAIAPGKSFEVHVDLKTDGKPQGKMETSVSLYSNDVRGVFTMRMHADVQTVLTISPEPTVNFGQITAADRVEGSVRVSSDSLDPFLLTVDTRFVTDPLAVEIEPVDPDAEGRSTTWEVKLTLGPDIPEGLRNYPVLLLTDQEVPFPKTKPADGKPVFYTARVYAQATVKGLVTASPGFLTFGMVRPGQVVERAVKIECFDDFPMSADVPVRIEAMRPEMEFPYRDRFTWTLEPTDDPKVLDFKLTLEGMPEDLNGSFGGYVRIDIGHPLKASIPIRFSGVCRQGLPGTTGGSATDRQTGGKRP